MSPATCEAVAAPARRARRDWPTLALRALVGLGAALTLAVLAGLVGFVIVRGVPHITADLFAWEYTSENVSLMPALVSTLLMAATSLGVAVPVGVAAAIYLVEYARPGSRLVAVVRLTCETLQGVPSIVYGLFGLLFFTGVLGWGLSLASGAATLALMVLPVIVRTTEEALMAVPQSWRQGSFALGAGRLRTVVRCVLPSAAPGIAGGALLALGRCVGEVAALLFTAGTVAQVPDLLGRGPGALLDSCRTLATHMYVLANEGLHVDEAYACAVVLLALVLVVNLATNLTMRLLKGSR